MALKQGLVESWKWPIRIGHDLLDYLKENALFDH